MSEKPKRTVYLDQAEDGWHVLNQEGEKIATFEPSAVGSFFCGLFIGGLTEYIIKRRRLLEKNDAL